MNEKFFSTEFARSSKFKWDFVNKIKDIDRWQHLSNNFETYIKNLNYKTISLKKIPKKIHQIWIGPKKIPKKYLDWAITWKNNNPDWDYKLWTNEDINDLNMINRSIYDSSDNLGFKSDLVRYEILYQYGGIYIDTDFECLKKIPDKLRDFDFVSCIGFNYTPEILNGFLMATRQSKIIKELITNLKSPMDKKDPMTVIKLSGPLKLSELYFKNYKNTSDNYMILPSNYCYPYPSFLINSSVKKMNEITSESFAIHHWEMSWMKGNYIKRFINKLSNIYRYLKNKQI
tara:strand:+ start:258 stop:1118 length:861 start_codon:yes stop_codon:yes gene_type:complete